MTISTSAPFSASVRAAIGPARMRVRSSTLIPESGRSPLGKGIGSLSPIFVISISGLPASILPCGCSSHSALERIDRAARARCSDRFFEIVRIPFRDRFGDRIRIGFAAERPRSRGRADAAD